MCPECRPANDARMHCRWTPGGSQQDLAEVLARLDKLEEAGIPVVAAAGPDPTSVCESQAVTIAVATPHAGRLGHHFSSPGWLDLTEASVGQHGYGIRPFLKPCRVHSRLLQTRLAVITHASDRIKAQPLPRVSHSGDDVG
jgi:hypothetical protein